MTEMLEKAIAQARRLPKDRQDAIAAVILDEIADEGRWDAAFSRSPDTLERLASEADEEDRKGPTRELDPESL